jgi:hypothetical protein
MAGSTQTLQDLATALQQQASSNPQLTLNTTNITANSFNWALQSMSVTSLVVQINNPTQQITYTAGTETLEVEGSCTLYGGSLALTLTLTGDDVSSATCDVDGNLTSFTLSEVVSNNLVPSGQVAISTLPTASLSSIALAVTAAASEFPTASFTLGADENPALPKLDILPTLGISLSKWGFTLERDVQQSGNVDVTFSINGSIQFGGMEVDLSLQLPTAALSFPNLWTLTFSSSTGKTGLSIANLTKALGGANLFQLLPSGITNLLSFSLKKLKIVFDATNAAVSSIFVDIGTSDWTVVSGFKILQAGFQVDIKNPFGSNRETDVNIYGDFQIGPTGGKITVLLGVFMTLPMAGGDWFAEIKGQIDKNDLNTVYGSLPGSSGTTLPSMPNGLNIQQIKLDYLDITFNPTSRTLPRIAFKITSKLTLPIIPNMLVVSDPQAEFDITNPLISANRTLTGSVSGNIIINDYLTLSLSASKETATSGWLFSGKMQPGEVIPIMDMVRSFLADLKIKSLPEWVEKANLNIRDLEASIQMPAEDAVDKNNTYSIKGAADWVVNVNTFVLPKLTATVDLQHSGGKSSGSITVDATLLGMDFKVGYDFGDSTKVYLSWEEIVCSYTSIPNDCDTISLVFGDKSLGDMVTALVRAIDPDFTLSAPWNIINKINLNGLSFEYIRYADTSPKKGQDSMQIIYSNANALDFTFIKFSKITLTKDNTGVYLGFEGSFLGIPISSTDPNTKGLAGKGSDVTNMPGVPGAGEKLFDLQYLGLGQHVILYPFEDLTTVEQANDRLQKVFLPPTAPAPGKPPILPIPAKPAEKPVESILVFDNNSSWLIGAQCTIMDTVDIAVIFNDPNLYGLLIFMHGDKAGIFKNLKFEILYKKVTDTVGVYQMQLQLPDVMRTLEFGEVSITLPIIGVDIYTNGSFKLDFGFPTNLDFSRSLSVQVFPFVGSGGFYFAYLKDIPSNSVPVTTVGRFSPIIQFGIGLSLGVGKTINAGILSAGLSLTVIGILEGVIASYNPNLPTYPGKGEYYYWIQGTFGIVGKIYGEINFAIISARLDITAYAYIRITIEAYNSIPIYFEAGVSVSLRVRINLGLFSIYISLSFSAKISASFVIGSDNRKNAPWNYVPGAQQQRLMKSRNTNITVLWQPLVLTAAEKPTLTLYFMPHLTLSGEIGNGQTAQYANLLFMKCTDPSNIGAPTSFDLFARGVLLWSINAYINSGQTGTTLDALLKQNVSEDDLTMLYCYLSENSTGFSTIPYTDSKNNDILHFLSNYFNINIIAPDLSATTDINPATAFPVLPSLQLNYVLNGNSSAVTDFSTYQMCDQTYLGSVQTQLAALAVDYENGVDSDDDNICAGITAPAPSLQSSLSLATFIFQDYVLMVAKAMVQDALNSFKTYRHDLSLANGLNNIVNYYNQAPLNNLLNAAVVATANKTVALTPGQNFNVAGVTYRVNATDNFNTVAALYNKNLKAPNLITPAQLATTNNIQLVGLVMTGVIINVSGFKPYTVTGNDSLTSIAANLEPVSGSGTATVQQVIDAIDAITGQPVLQLFALLEIPQFVYVTGQTDSFETISTAYSTTVDILAGVNGAITFTGTSITISGTTTDSHGDTVNCLSQLPVSTIADSTCTAENISKVSGMSSRFLLHGLRLPNPSNLNTLLPLYLLMGQQITLPALKQNDTFSVQLNKAAATTWISFAGNSAATQLPVAIDNHEISRINDLISLQLAPVATAQPMTLFNTSKQTFTLKTDLDWQYPGQLQLPIGTPLSQTVITPTIWQLPETLMQLLYNNTSGKDLQLVLKTITQEQPNTPYVRAGVQNYGWATLVNVSIKKINNNDAPVSGNAYNVQGADEQGIVFLQRLLTYINQNSDSIINQIMFLYAPNQTGNSTRHGLQSQANGAYITSLVQANLSTETNPITNFAFRALAGPPRNTLNTFKDFITLLWQCSIVRSGGYYLYYNVNDGNTGLPEYLFNEDGSASISLLISYGATVPVEGFINQVVIADTIDTEKSSVYVESELLTVKSAIVPPGNAGVTLSRNYPGDYVPINPYPIPADSASAAMDMIYLSTQFNLMGYNLVAGTGFKAAPLNLMPVGAADSLSDEELTEKRLSEIAQTQIWNYETMLPVYRYATSAIQPSDPGYPSAVNDPYSGLGGTAVIQLNWQDMFGNIINTPLSQSSQAVKANVLYTDVLYNLSKWPNISFGYSFNTLVAGNNLHIDFSFDSSRYTGSDGVQKANIDSVIYSTIYYQLLQPDVTCTLATTLNADKTNQNGTPVTVDKTQLVNYAGTIYKYLQTIIDPKLPPVVVTDPSFLFNVSPANADDIFELKVAITIARTANIDPNFTDVAGVSSVLCPISPSTNVPTAVKTSDVVGAQSTPQSLQVFAEQFEATFKGQPTAGILLKIATGVTQEEVNSQSGGNTIWVVRFDTTGQHGINFTVDPANQYFYSPIPLSVSLQTYPNVPINDYVTGQPFSLDPQTAKPKNFAAVDLDNWGVLCLNAIDELLAPEYAVPAFIIDNGVTLQQILDAKEALADAITGTVDHIIDTQSKLDSISNAQEVFRQQLLIQLSNAYTIDAIVQNPVAVSSPYTGSNVQPQDKGPYNPMIYGQMQGTGGNATASRMNVKDTSEVSNEYSLSTTKIPMGNGKSWMNYVFSAKEADKSSSYQFANMACQVSHIEHMIQEVPGIEGYKASSWLNFVVPLDSSFGQAGAVNIPIPLRSYPTPPSIIEQQSIYSPTGVLPVYTTMEEAKQWDFNFTYKQQKAAQDTINVSVEFNIDNANMFRAADPNVSLLPEALAQFVSVYPAINKDLLDYLAKVNVTTKSTDATFINAKFALQAFATVVAKIALEWGGWNQVNPIKKNLLRGAAFGGQQLPAWVIVDYVIEELAGKDTTGKGLKPELWAILTDGEKTNKNIPTPGISIEGYTTLPVDNEANTFHFYDEATKEFLTYDERGSVTTRQLDFEELNILDWQNAWAGIYVTRNKDLVKNSQGTGYLPTNKLFIYQTPLVKFYNQLNPLLTCNEGINVAAMNKNGKPAPDVMAVHIFNLFSGLLQSTGNNSQMVKTECMYTYNLNGTSLYNTIDLPVLLVPPKPIDPTTDLNIGSSPPYCIEGNESFACQVAGALLTWYGLQGPSDNNAAFQFSIVVYDAFNNQLPLLKINYAILSVSYITDLPVTGH